MPKKSDYKSSDGSKKTTNETQTLAQKTLLSKEKLSKATHEGPQSPKVSRRQNTKGGGKNRRVKFADPLTHQLVYERPVVLKAPPTDDELNRYESLTSIANSLKQTTSTLSGQKHEHDARIDQLEPPFSLVAHLDIAAQKLHARDKHHKSNASPDNKHNQTFKKDLSSPEDLRAESQRSMKSMKSGKSSKSAVEGVESKSIKK